MLWYDKHYRWYGILLKLILFLHPVVIGLYRLSGFRERFLNFPLRYQDKYYSGMPFLD